MSDNIGIIAGEGEFPFLVVQGVKDTGKKVFVVAIKGHTRQEIAVICDDIIWIHIGQLGKLINFFKRNSVKKVIFAGAINKPKALNIRPDFRAAKLILKLRSHSDNSLLEAVVEELENEGFSVVSPISYVPYLQTPEGFLTKRKPDKRELLDIKYGWPIAKKLGEMDIGQTIVVKNKMVVAVEAMEGTNNTIIRAGSLVGEGTVVIKIFKPNQSPVVDQPTIGLKTIEVMHNAGARVLAIEAKRSLFFNREEAISFANKVKISIVGISESPNSI